MYKVYKHTNKTNGKMYIGITGQKSVNSRWHRGEGYKECNVFYNAIKKYGWDGFDHEILFDGLTKEEAEAKEVELIALYHSNDGKHGYNVENGGHVNKYTEEQKEQMRQRNLGKKHSEETKRKMSEVHKGMSTQWLTGRKASDETRQKMSQSQSRTNNGRAKTVYQYKLDGSFVEKYDYMDLIKDALNITSTAHISQCCNGKRKKAHGFMWSYILEDKSPYVRQWKGGHIHG